jgi:hypothetical protein
MKKLALILALLLVSSQVTAVAYTKKAAARTQKVNQKSDVQVYKQDGNDYLLKYNIDDLEAAPWINGGKRVYDNETYSKYTPMGKR